MSTVTSLRKQGAQRLSGNLQNPGVVEYCILLLGINAPSLQPSGF